MQLRSLPSSAALLAALAALGCAASVSGGESPPPGAPVISSFTATPSTISAPGSSTLSWSVTGATSLSVDHGVGTVTGTSASVSPAATTTYTLTAANSVGSDTASTTVTVSGSTVPVISSFTATPSTIGAGGSSTLSWSVTGATSLSIDHGVGTVTGTSVSVSPAATTTYTLTATNASGSVTASTTVTVSGSSVPVISSFTATPSTIGAGGSSTLSWSVTGATSLSIDQGVGTVTGTSVSVNPAATTTYTLTATNASGSVTASTTVTVSNGTAPVVDTGFPGVASTWMDYAAGAAMTTPTFTTGGPTRILVALVSWYPPHTDPWPTTLGWAAGTPAGATAWQMVRRSDTTAPIHWCTEIWWATATEQLTNVQVRATRTGAPDPNTGILAVYSIANAATAWGALGSEVGSGLTLTRVEVPITPTASNSLILGISQYGDFYDFSVANALTTIDYQHTDSENGWGGDGGAAAWHKTTAPVAGIGYTLGVTLPGGSTNASSGLAIEVLPQ